MLLIFQLQYEPISDPFRSMGTLGMAAWPGAVQLGFKPVVPCHPDQSRGSGVDVPHLDGVRTGSRMRELTSP